MPCYKPRKAWRGIPINENGKRPMVFNAFKALNPDHHIFLPCGSCIGCRLENSRQWAIRCIHESKLHQQNCFITLTLDDEHLPDDHSLNHETFTLFMKRFRYYLDQRQTKIKFRMCGEYGETFGRPHYHALIFGYQFDDLKLWKNEGDIKLYTSTALEKLWKNGYTTVGELTFESAAYVARYITKKITGEPAIGHYQTVNWTTGEILTRIPEYATQSQHFGDEWIYEYMNEVYPDDFIIIRGKKMKPPKRYDQLYELGNPEEFAKIKEKRRLDGIKRKWDNTPERLRVRETVAKARQSQNPRKL